MARKAGPYLLLLGGLAALVWAISFGTLPPADFTFSNSSEVKSIDPAVVTGQPEGRVVRALFEGLCAWDPKTCAPIPGVAESWEISEDERTYTFHLRDDARWSDGSPVTAHDFEWSMRRFLHPATASEYASELWYPVGAKAFNGAKVKVADPVEIELDEPPPPGRPGAAGPIVRGTATAISGEEGDENRIFTVEIDGRHRRFRQEPSREDIEDGVEDARWILPDFEKTVGIRAIDAQTLVIDLKAPVKYFLKVMGFYPLYPVNRNCIETYGSPEWTKPENVVCNGPFRLQFRRIRDRMRLVKNPHYWDAENVKLEVIDVLAVESNTTNLNLYMTGEIDWFNGVPLEVIPELSQREDRDFRPLPYLSTYYYIFNTEKPPLDDPRVRRALSMALDRETVCREVTRAGQQPAFSLVPAQIADSMPYEPPQCESEDVVRARALLAEAGFPDGKGFPRLTILYNTMEAHQAIAEMIQAQWKRNLGIDVALANQEWTVYLDSRMRGRFDVARAGWTGDYIDPSTFLKLNQSDDPNNHSRWKNAEYDALLKAAEGETDPERRLELLADAERILMDELPVLPLYAYVDQNMVRPYVRGFHRNLLDTHPLKDIWIDEEEKRRIFEKEGLQAR